MTEGLIKPNINVAPPLEYYESLIITGELKPDSLQELGAKKLQNIYDKLDEIILRAKTLQSMV